MEAEVAVEVATTWQFKVPVAMPFAGGVIAAGAVQETPGGKIAGRLIATGELNPLLEVIVINVPLAVPVDEFRMVGCGG